LSEELAKVHRADGRALKPDVRAPRDIYRQVNGDSPDLMVYFGDLRCRSAGTVGHPELFIAENDTGPDDAVHSFEGVYLLVKPEGGPAGPSVEQSILDVAPTLLTRMNEPIPPHVQGRVIPDWV